MNDNFGQLIWWLFVAVFVIVKLIAKARKGQPAGTPSKPVADETPSSPADELRRFLESLGVPQEPASTTTSPAPAPPAPPVRRTPAPVPPDRSQPRRASLASLSKKPSTAATDDAGDRAEVRRPALSAAPPGMPAAPSRGLRQIMADLQNRDALQRAMIEREILSLPLALRRP